MAKSAKKTSNKAKAAKKTKKAAKKSVNKKTSKKAKKASKKTAPKKAAGKKTKKIAAKKKTTAKKKKPSTKSKSKEAGLSQKDIDHFKELLLEKRRELIGDVSHMENEGFKNSRLDSGGDLSTMPIHMADMGSDNFEQEFSLGLMDGERKLLHEINLALDRIYEGTYGVCEGTGKQIPKPRLEALPWAKYTIEYATMIEKGQVIEGEKVYDEEYDEDFEDFDEEDELGLEDDEEEEGIYDLLDVENLDDEEEDNY